MNQAYFRRAMISAVAITAITSQAALAEGTYQTEVTAGYVSIKGSQNEEISLINTAVQMYFSPVDTTLGPYAEAAFLNRAGSLTAELGYLDMDLNGLEADGPVFALSADFAGADQPLAASIGYSRSRISFSDISGLDLTVTKIDLGVGVFPTDGLFFGVGYETSESKVSFSGFGSMSADTDTVSSVAKWVRPLQGDQALNLQGGVRVVSPEDEGSFKVYDLRGDFYPTQKLGLGAGVEIVDWDEADSTEMELRVTFFPTASVGLLFAVGKFFADSDAGGNATQVTAGIAGRF